MSRGDRQTGARRKRFELDRMIRKAGRTRARRTAFAVRKEQPNAFNALSIKHTQASDTLRGVSQKSNVESCKELLRDITSITRSATSERWGLGGVSGKKGNERSTPTLSEYYYEGKATASEKVDDSGKQTWT